MRCLNVAMSKHKGQQLFLSRGWLCNWHFFRSNKSSMSRTDPEFLRTKDKYAGKSQRVWFLFLSDTCAQLSSQRPAAGAGTAGDSWPVIARDRPLLSRQSIHSPRSWTKERHLVRRLPRGEDTPLFAFGCKGRLERTMKQWSRGPSPFWRPC